MEELLNWLQTNKIQHKQIEEDVVEIPEFGKLLFQDMTMVNTILRKDNDGELIFNSMEDPAILANDGIFHIAFKFGDNWYYQDVRKDFDMKPLKYIGLRMEAENKTPFVNLGIHTPYELLNGSFMPGMWINKAKYLGHNAIGVCDRNTMASLLSVQKECQKAGMKYVFGYSLTFTYGDHKVDAKIYVQTQEGLRNLLRIQKAVMVDSEDQTISFDELVNRGNGNVLVFGKLSAPFLVENLHSICETVENAFDNVFFQVDLSEYKAERIDIQYLNSQKLYFDALYHQGLKPVLICDCYYLDKDDAKNKIILNKIDLGTSHEQSDDQYFKDVDEHYAVFKALFDAGKWDIDNLFAECCSATVSIAEGSNAMFETTRNFMPKYDMTPEETAKYGTTHNMFKQLLEEGLEKLVPKARREEYRKQMEYERYIIESTNNVDYLLVQYDTVNWCRKNNVLVGCGRGSAAGCLLLYLLGITLIDPIKYGLIFERFLLPERAGCYAAETTIIGQEMESSSFMELTLENEQTLKVDKDSELIVKRDGYEEPIKVYADELQESDDIIFDNRDLIFTLNEI